MTRKGDTTTVSLDLPVELAERLHRLAQELGGPSVVVGRALIMAPVSARRALLAEPRRGETPINVPFSRDELVRVGEEGERVGMSKGAWVRAVVRARLDRAPQLSWDEALASSAVRVELLRISDRLRVAAQGVADRGDDPRAVIECWREARRTLEGLRAALVGNLLYWTPIDD